jgi:hypothetical protein
MRVVGAELSIRVASSSVLMKAPWDEDAMSEAGMDDDFVLKVDAPSP